MDHPVFMLITSFGSLVLQVTLAIELNDTQVDEFERMIPVQLAQPPWNYTLPLNKGIKVSLSLKKTWCSGKYGRTVVTAVVVTTLKRAILDNHEQC